MKKILNGNNKGITMLALIITIVVLMILAGVSINMLVGENGMITKAKEANKLQKVAEIKEKMQLEILDAETEAIIRNEQLEQEQLNDIIAKYGTLQEDGDTIITKEDEYEISLKEIWYGVLSESGSYGDKKEQIAILEKELEELNQKYEELEALNAGNSTVLEELREEITALENERDSLQEEYDAFREAIVAAITEQGIETSKEDTTETITDNIKRLVENGTEGTATEAQILSGQVAWANGIKLTGSMTNNGAVTKTLNAGASYTIPAGYHNGSGKVTANSLASQTQATATANNIASGVTAWVNGTKNNRKWNRY